MIGRRKFRTEEARTRYTRRLRIVTAVGFFLFLLTCYGTYLVLQSDAFKLQVFSVSTDGVLERTEIEKYIQKELTQEIFGIIPRSSIFISQKKYVEDVLRKTYPRIAEVKVKRVGFSSLNIDLTEKKPTALWCGDIVPSIAEKSASRDVPVSDDMWGTCYTLDSHGYIYAKAPVFSGNVFPRYYGSLEKAEPIGQQFVPEADFERWQLFYTSLIQETVYPMALLFVDEQDIEVFLSNGIKMFIPRTSDIEKTKENYETVFGTAQVVTEKEIEYIDFRFGNKVFIKYVNEEPINL